MNENQKIYPVIVIGGGPSGISCSYHLKKQGIEHLIIEKKEMLQTWKNERWDSFYLVTPNWMTNLSCIDHELPYNNEYMSKDEIYRWLKNYMDHVNPKYSDHTHIKRLWKEDNLYYLETDKGLFRGEKIIIAIGLFNQPWIPEVAKKIGKEVHQIHSVEYFNPSQLQNGNTIVVGSGRSGIQIALEIKNETGNEVYLSVGSLTPLPTIYKNVNGVYWLNRLSGFSKGKGILPYEHKDLKNENIRNKINQNLYHCVQNGVKLTGRLTDSTENQLYFLDNLREVLEKGKIYLQKVEKQIDDAIKESGLSLPELHLDFDLKHLDYNQIESITHLDIQENHIKNIIWCTGFKPDYSWIDLDIFDECGMPDLVDGCSTQEEVYFCGMGLQPDKETKSSFGVGLFAVEESAERAVKALLKKM